MDFIAFSSVKVHSLPLLTHTLTFGDAKRLLGCTGQTGNVLILLSLTLSA
jgi:hypothetical protein